MSRIEIDRLNILTKIKEGSLKQVKASELLNLSTRQVRNLLKQLNKWGPKRIISQKRGKVSNRKSKEKGKILKLVQEEYEVLDPH